MNQVNLLKVHPLSKLFKTPYGRVMIALPQDNQIKELENLFTTYCEYVSDVNPTGADRLDKHPKRNEEIDYLALKKIELGEKDMEKYKTLCKACKEIFLIKKKKFNGYEATKYNFIIWTFETAELLPENCFNEKWSCNKRRYIQYLTASKCVQIQDSVVLEKKGREEIVEQIIKINEI